MFPDFGFEISQQRREYSREWWTWLLATGTFMACAWSSKVNGILTVFTIGVAVLVDLWDILDYRKNSMVRQLTLYGWLQR